MSVSSVTSDRSYLQIVKNNNTLVSATSHNADPDGTSFSTTSPTGDPVLHYDGSVTIDHDIGTVPIVRAFRDANKNGRLYNTTLWTSGGYQSNAGGSTLLTLSTTTTTKLIITSASSVSDVPVYYRIYRFGTLGFTSDAAIDKIFTVSNSTKVVGAASASDSPVRADDTIPHGAGEKIFWTLQFSLDQVNWYNEGVLLFGSPDTSTGPPGGPYARYYYVTAYGSADAANFYTTYVHNYSSQQTIYTRYTLDYIGATV